MAYSKAPQLIARRGYSGVPALGGIGDLVTRLLGGVSGANQMTQAQIDAQQAIAAQSPINATNILLLGGAGFLAYKLLHKKKAA